MYVCMYVLLLLLLLLLLQTQRHAKTQTNAKHTVLEQSHTNKTNIK